MTEESLCVSGDQEEREEGKRKKGEQVDFPQSQAAEAA